MTTPLDEIATIVQKAGDGWGWLQGQDFYTFTRRGAEVATLIPTHEWQRLKGRDKAYALIADAPTQVVTLPRGGTLLVRHDS